MPANSSGLRSIGAYSCRRAQLRLDSPAWSATSRGLFVRSGLPVCGIPALTFPKTGPHGWTTNGRIVRRLRAERVMSDLSGEDIVRMLDVVLGRTATSCLFILAADTCVQGACHCRCLCLRASIVFGVTSLCCCPLSTGAGSCPFRTFYINAIISFSVPLWKCGDPFLSRKD